MNKTSIQWTDYTWNPLVGCRRVSPGCERCYAERLIATRLKRLPVYEGIAKFALNGPRFTGEHRLITGRLDAPPKKRRGVKVFVNDLGDLFYEGHTFEEIAAVFGAMAKAQQHTFQVLTKRPARMRQWFEWFARWGMSHAGGGGIYGTALEAVLALRGSSLVAKWPLRNVWLGDSIEDQRRANERILDLLHCPAPVHFLSVEPMLESIDLTRMDSLAGPWSCLKPSITPETVNDPRRVDWVICGGESGPKAREFDLSWARFLRDQCKDAGVAFFMKQLGAQPMQSREDGRRFGSILDLRDSHGGNMAEWPSDLRVREFPKVNS